LSDQHSLLVEARSCARKGESYQQAKHGKYRALNHAKITAVAVRLMLAAAKTKTTTRFEHGKHAEKQQQSENERIDGGFHAVSPHIRAIEATRSILRKVDNRDACSRGQAVGAKTAWHEGPIVALAGTA
jgi:hypothetical protein